MRNNAHIVDGDGRGQYKNTGVTTIVVTPVLNSDTIEAISFRRSLQLYD
ncbi:MAG: hypothetical protein P8K66_10595 [Planctomycetota bacterium]|nr:hypothetical protein [Planctomycetota bacterium]